MKTQLAIRYKTFTGESGDTFTVGYDNRGEPYREGAYFRLRDGECGEEVSVFLEKSELREVVRLLTNLGYAP